MKENSRTELVQFRTTKKEKAARQKAADSAGMTLSDWCRVQTERSLMTDEGEKK